MRKIATRVRAYRDAEFPGMAGKKALRFIDGNFRKQSWEGVPWKRRKGGKRNSKRALLIDKGFLRRGTNFRSGSGQVMVYNYVKYAKAHNNGLNTLVTVKAHERKAHKFKIGQGIYNVKTKRERFKHYSRSAAQVKSHARNMRMPRRQFMPTAERPSPTLNREISREVKLQMLKILKP